MNILAFLNEQGVLMFCQLVVGKYLKGHPEFQNRYLPWVTWALAVVGYGIMPATAHAASALGLAVPYAGTFLLATFQSVLTTGLHSFSKNAIGPHLSNGLKALAYRILGGGK